MLAYLARKREPEWQDSIPKVDRLARQPAMAAAILKGSCDQREDEERSPDLVTNEQSNPNMKKANPSITVRANKRLA